MIRDRITQLVTYLSRQIRVSVGGVVLGRETGAGSAQELTLDGLSITAGVLTVVGKQATLVSGTNIKTVNGSSLLGSGNISTDLTSGPVTSSGGVSAIADGALSIGKVNGLQATLDGKQSTLVSGTNIKTVNGSSLLGSGNIEVGVTNSSVVDAIEDDPAAVRVAAGSRPRYAHNIDTAMAAMRMYIESNRSTGFKVAGDSLGNAPEEYVGGLASHIAAQYPNLRVVTRLITENANSAIREWTETVVQAADGERYWLTPPTSTGNYAILYSQNDCPAPTGDFEIEVKIRVANWEANNGCDLVGWWGGTSPLNRVAKVVMFDSRRLRLQWYNSAGTLQSNLTGNLGTVAGAVVATAPADGTDWWLRVRFDADNGSGGTDVSFWKSTDGANWTLMTTITNAGTTGIYDNSSAGYTACSLSGSTTTGLKDTRLYALRVRHGHGTKTVNLLPIDRANQSSASNLCTLYGSPTLVIENYSYPGYTTASLVADANTHWDRLMGNNGDALVMCHAGMNDTWAGGYTTGSAWTDGIQILIDKMLSRAPLAHPVLIATNPRVSTTAGVGGATTTNIQSQTFMDHHGLRHGRMALYAQQKRYGFVNWHRAIKDDGRPLTTLIPDGVHPTTTAYAEIINPILNQAFDAP